MSKNTLTIGFGPLVPPISKQLKQQGFKFSADQVKHFEKMRKCVTTLMFADILTNDQVDKAYKN